MSLLTLLSLSLLTLAYFLVNIGICPLTLNIFALVDALIPITKMSDLFDTGLFPCGHCNLCPCWHLPVSLLTLAYVPWHWSSLLLTHMFVSFRSLTLLTLVYVPWHWLSLLLLTHWYLLFISLTLLTLAYLLVDILITVFVDTDFCHCWHYDPQTAVNTKLSRMLISLSEKNVFSTNILRST